MIINELRMENFRQYYGQNTIDFAKDPEKNFTIIQGTNGAGKTTILNAITWCLYGVELHNVTDDPIYNEVIENETPSNGKFKVKVEIEMLNRNNELTTFKRERNFHKNNEGIVRSPILADQFSIFEEESRNNKPVEFPDLYVDTNMPEDIEEYFFFDGEKLEDYFRENTGKVIKKSVFKITQLKLLKRLIDHLDERRRHYANKVKQISPDTGAIEQEIIDKEDSLNENIGLLKKASEQRKIAEKKIKHYEKELKRCGSSDIKTMQIEREELERDIHELDNKIDSAKKDKIDFILEMTPIILAYPSLQKTLQEASKLKEKGFIPVKYKRKFLEDLIDEGVCICGIKLSENDECKKTLQKLWEKTSTLTDIGDEIGIEHTAIESLLEKLNNFRDKQKKLGKDIHWLIKERKKRSQRLKEISIHLKESEIVKIQEFEEMLQENKRIQITKIREEAELEAQIKSTKEDIKKLKKKRAEETQKNAELENLNYFVLFCEKSLDVSKKLQKELIEDIRARIEKTTKEQFLKLNWKESFVDVLIDDDYDVKVVRKSGRVSDANGLSAGEKLILALSFMAALNQISGFNLPIIIDTPMGRLDKELKLNIAKVIPKYLEDKQITLLVTGEEYSDEFRDKLSHRVSKEYIINVTQTENGNKSEVVLNGS